MLHIVHWSFHRRSNNILHSSSSNGISAVTPTHSYKRPFICSFTGYIRALTEIMHFPWCYIFIYFCICMYLSISFPKSNDSPTSKFHVLAILFYLESEINNMAVAQSAVPITLLPLTHTHTLTYTLTHTHTHTHIYTHTHSRTLKHSHRLTLT
jgi:hypothetical protein